jgi:hypothetical protein
MTCNRPAIQGWEAFAFGIVAPATAQTLAESSGTEAFTTGQMVYPNPVRQDEALNVTVKGYIAREPVSIVVTDMSGNARVQQTGYTETIIVPAAGLEKGLYIVRVRNGENEYTQKIQVR